LGFQVPVFGFRVSGFEFRVSGFGFQVSYPSLVRAKARLFKPGVCILKLLPPDGDVHVAAIKWDFSLKTPFENASRELHRSVHAQGDLAHKIQSPP